MQGIKQSCKPTLLVLIVLALPKSRSTAAAHTKKNWANEIKNVSQNRIAIFQPNYSRSVGGPTFSCPLHLVCAHLLAKSNATPTSNSKAGGKLSARLTLTLTQTPLSSSSLLSSSFCCRSIAYPQALYVIAFFSFNGAYRTRNGTERNETELNCECN